MFKPPSHIYDINSFGNNEMTPIRDYKNDFFHKDDQKLPLNPTLRNYNTSFYQPQHLKRPPSLKLNDKNQPLIKKTNSPKMIEKEFTDPDLHSSIESTDKPTGKIASALFLIYKKEVDFMDDMKYAINIYRKDFNKRFVMNLMDTMTPQNELLLFGNIETIIAISRIFIDSLRNLLLKIISIKASEDIHLKTEKSTEKYELSALSDLEIGDILRQNLSRMKATYSTYVFAHKNQMALLKSMEANQEVNIWLDEKSKIANNLSLEELLIKPIMKIKQWDSDLRGVCDAAYKELTNNQIEGLLEVKNDYLKFVSELDKESSEFDDDTHYDFALTPSDIIQSYSLLTSKPTRNSLILTKKKSYSNHSRQESFQSQITDSSSVYSEHTFMNETESRLKDQKTNRSTSAKDRASVEPVTLKSTIRRFFHIRNKIKDLKRVMNLNSFDEYLNGKVLFLKKWRNIVDCNNTGENCTPRSSDIWPSIELVNSYRKIEETKRQKEQLTILELTDLQLNVVDSLNELLKRCEVVKERLDHLKVLKKDYLSYLRSRSSHHAERFSFLAQKELKKNIIAKHFEAEQQLIAHQLPVFIDLALYIIAKIIANYNIIILKTFRVISGLSDDTFKNETSNKDSRIPLSVSIIDQYSSSRYEIKKSLRDNWMFDQDPRESRVVRRFFEL